MAGGVRFFFTLDQQTVGTMGGFYMVLAALAAVLLVMPVISLAGPRQNSWHVAEMSGFRRSVSSGQVRGYFGR